MRAPGLADESCGEGEGAEFVLGVNRGSEVEFHGTEVGVDGRPAVDVEEVGEAAVPAGRVEGVAGEGGVPLLLPGDAVGEGVGAVVGRAGDEVGACGDAGLIAVGGVEGKVEAVGVCMVEGEADAVATVQQEFGGVPGEAVEGIVAVEGGTVYQGVADVGGVVQFVTEVVGEGGALAGGDVDGFQAQSLRGLDDCGDVPVVIGGVDEVFALGGFDAPAFVPQGGVGEDDERAVAAVGLHVSPSVACPEGGKLVVGTPPGTVSPGPEVVGTEAHSSPLLPAEMGTVFAPDDEAVVGGEPAVVRYAGAGEHLFFPRAEEDERSGFLYAFFVSEEGVVGEGDGGVVVGEIFVAGGDGVESVGLPGDFPKPDLAEFVEVVLVEGAFRVAVGVGFFEAVGVSEEGAERGGVPKAVPLAADGEGKAFVEWRDAEGAPSAAFHGFAPEFGTVVEAGVGCDEVAHGVASGHVVFVGAEYDFMIVVKPFFDDLRFHLVQKFGRASPPDVPDGGFETYGIPLDEPHGQVDADDGNGKEFAEEVV